MATTCRTRPGREREPLTGGSSWEGYKFAETSFSFRSGVAFLSKHTLAGELERGELTTFRLAGLAPLLGYISVARLAAVPLGPAERRFVQTLVRTSAEQPSLGQIQMVGSDNRKPHAP